VDTEALAPTIATFVAADNIVNDAEALAGFNITGTGEVGATVTLSLTSGTVLAGGNTATVAGDGTWSIAVEDADVTAFGEGAETITASQTDLAGNTSLTATRAITVDTSAPAAPADPDLDPTDDLGTSNTDDITSRTVGLTFNGTSEANAAVTLFNDDDDNAVFDGVDTILGTAVAGGGGAWTIDSSTLAAGTYVVRAFATDAAGNVSAASAGATVLQVEVDTTIPTVPGGLNLADNDDSGISAFDNLTNNTAALTINGTGDNDSVVRLFDDADNSGFLDGAEAVLATATVAGGVWSSDIALAASATAHRIKAFATDVAGNESAASEPLNITVDTTAPTAPAMLDLAVGDDSGSDGTDNITNVNSNLHLSGTAELGARVEIYQDAVLLSTVTADGVTGVFSYVVAGTLADAPAYAFTAKQIDAAGNVSLVGAALNVTVDTVGPSVTYTGAYYSGQDYGALTDALTISGTGFNSWGAATGTTDIKDLLDLGGLTLDTDNNNATFNYALQVGDVASAFVKDDNTLILNLTPAGVSNIQTPSFGQSNIGTGTAADWISISQEFAGEDTAGNIDSNGALTTRMDLLGEQNEGGMPHTYSFEAGVNGATDDTLGETGVSNIDVDEFNFAGLSVIGLSASQMSLVTFGGGLYILENRDAIGGVADNSINLIDLPGAFDTRVPGTGVTFADGSILVENTTASTTLSGTKLNDQLIAGANGDRLLGNAGNDLLIGGVGADAIYGGTGTDIIYGAGGNDYLSGGTGADTFIYTTGNGDDEGQDVIAGFSAGNAPGHDVINVDGASNAADVLALAAQSGADTLIRLNGDESIRLLGVNLGALHVANFSVASAYINGTNL
jgi:hypothetical protein